MAGIRVEQRGEHVNIQNNRVLKNRVGIHAEGRNVDIINNEVWSNTGTGIIVDNAWSKVSRNTVFNNGGGLVPQIDFNSQPPDTCLVGNRTNFGIVPWGAGCQEDNN